MTPAENISRNLNNVKGFRLIPAVILVLLILVFFGAAAYVLMSSFS